MDMCHAILQDNGVTQAIDKLDRVDTEGALGEAFDAETIVKKVMPDSQKNSYIMAKVIQNICRVYLCKCDLAKQENKNSEYEDLL